MGAYDDLTLKQRRWVDAYLMTGNATESARRAGYKGNDHTLGSVGGENLTKPEIQSALKERGAKAELRRIADADEVLETLTTIARGEVPVDASRIRALELLGKRYRLFGDEEQSKSAPILVLVLPRVLSPKEYEGQWQKWREQK